MLNYANKALVDELRDELQNKASVEQINVIASENASIMKDVNNFATTKEVSSRF